MSIQSEEVTFAEAIGNASGLASSITTTPTNDGSGNWTFAVVVTMGNICTFAQSSSFGTAPAGQVPPTGCYPIIVVADTSCKNCRRGFIDLPYSVGPAPVPAGDTRVIVYVMENGEVSLSACQNLD